MNAVRLHAPGDVRLHEEPPPIPEEGEALVRVTAVGLCGSDRHWFVDGGIGDATLTDPLVLGHEFVGVVESGPRRGRRVAVDPAITCRRCAMCLAGQPNLCTEVRFAGHSIDGALRSLVAWPENLLHPLPDTLPDAEATLLEPLGVAVHAVDLGHVRPGTSAAVLGCGPLGLLLVRLLLAVGAAPVVAATTAAAPCRGRRGGPGGRPRTRPRSRRGVDVVFDVTDVDTAGQAVDAARPGGRIVLVGIPSGDRTTFTASTARRKGLSILLCRRMQPVDLERALRLVESGSVRTGSLVSERFGLSEAREAFAALADRRGLKVVVEPERRAHDGAVRGRHRLRHGIGPRRARRLRRRPRGRTPRSTPTATASSTSVCPRPTTPYCSSPTGRSKIPTTTSGRSRRPSRDCSETGSRPGARDRRRRRLHVVHDAPDARRRHAALPARRPAPQPHAWVKLWKHHAAQPEADRINEVAEERAETWLPRYGGRISSEWFFAKALQILDEAPDVYAHADRLIEAADWAVWQLTGVETRNTCTAGYKAMWSKRDGSPLTPTSPP